MRRLRRPTAILAVLMIAHTMVLGGGAACAFAGMGLNVPAGAAATMTGMPMGDTPAQPGQGAPCRLPWAPAGCHTMVLCAPAAVVAEPLAGINEPAPLSARVMATTVLAPPARPTAPEPPPPRA